VRITTGKAKSNDAGDTPAMRQAEAAVLRD
jgi:hypothetical protein